MQALESLKRRIKSTKDLQSVVKTMKSFAAVNIRQYERAVESLGEYNLTIEMGFQIVLKEGSEDIIRRLSTHTGRLGAIIFGSDQGMVGQFNEQIASFAINRMNILTVNHEDRVVVAVGGRLIPCLEEAGQAIDELLSVPSSLTGITWMVQEVLMKIELWRQQKEINQIALFYNTPLSGSSYRPHMLYLLPIDLNWLQNLEKKQWPSHVLPTFSMDRDRLFSLLIREYFFVSLYSAFAESLASENASRLASMRAADKNIEERLEELNAQFHHQRQSSITAELLDIVAGFEALTGVKVG